MLGFMEVFLQNNNHQVVKKMEWIENRKNTDKKPLGFRMKVYELF